GGDQPAQDARVTAERTARRASGRARRFHDIARSLQRPDHALTPENQRERPTPTGWLPPPGVTNAGEPSRGARLAKSARARRAPRGVDNDMHAYYMRTYEQHDLARRAQHRHLRDPGADLGPLPRRRGVEDLERGDRGDPPGGPVRGGHRVHDEAARA